MKSTLNLLPLTMLPLLTASFPLIPLRPRASYSVVAVDGGSTTTPAPAAPTTITSLQTLTHTQTFPVTQLSTLVITENSTPTTIVVTVTTPQPTTVIETVTTEVEATVTVTDVSVSVSEETVLQTQTVAPETAPYDNGMWHTTYYYTVAPTETASSTATPTAETQWVDAALPEESASASATPAADNGAWTPPSGVDDGSWERWKGPNGGWTGQKI
jgi:hypothetical protein